MVNRALAQRNAQIRTEIMGMMKIKSDQGHQKYTSAYIYDHIAAKHGLKSRTVKNIFWETGVYCLPTAPPHNVATPA